MCKAIDASGEQAFYARGHSCCHHGCVKVRFAGRATNYAPLSEEADDFLGKERIAVSLLSDLQYERLGQNLSSEPRRYNAANVINRKRFQAQLGDNCAIEPRWRVFRAARRYKQ